MSGGSGLIDLHNANIIQYTHVITGIGYSYETPRYVVLSEMNCFDTNTWAFKIGCANGSIIVRTATRMFAHNGGMFYIDCATSITHSIHTYYKWKLFYMGIAQNGALNDVFSEMLKYYHLL